MRWANHQGQTLSRVLVDQRQPLQRAAVARAVEDEVSRPNTVFMLCPLAVAALGAMVHTPLFPACLRHVESFATPQPMDAFTIHASALPP